MFSFVILNDDSKLENIFVHPTYYTSKQPQSSPSSSQEQVTIVVTHWLKPRGKQRCNAYIHQNNLPIFVRNSVTVVVPYWLKPWGKQRCDVCIHQTIICINHQPVIAHKPHYDSANAVYIINCQNELSNSTLGQEADKSGGTT